MRVNCPYCNKEANLVDSIEIYGTSYGMAFRCKPCDAYVGCHKGTNNPLGTLANLHTRKARNLAHRFFDPLWNRAMKRKGISKSKARHQAYKWLSEQMELSMSECHIAMFTEEQCQKVVHICEPYSRNVKPRSLR